VFDGELSRTWYAFAGGLVGSQGVAGAAEQVYFGGEGVAVADGGAAETFGLQPAGVPPGHGAGLWPPTRVRT
jgi:hypothetical protein